MICESTVKQFCRENIELIENYENAMNDKTQTWECHHRLELQNGKTVLREELINQGLYYNRPASELIFLTKSEHMSLHSQNKTPDGLKRISKYMSNRIISEETRIKTSNSVKKYQAEHPLTEEQHKQMSNIQRQMRYYNNGVINTKAKECPEGFVPGKLPYYSKGNLGMKWFNNGSIEIQCYPEDCPKGFTLGKLPFTKEHCKHIKDSRKQLMKNPEYIKKLSEANKGKKRYTNGIKNITLRENEPCPEGFWRGATRKDSKRKSNHLF